MSTTPGTASADTREATAAWHVSPADIAALDARVVADDLSAGANSPCACASLPATTSVWLDGLLSTHGARRR
ncbi:hypothetical protein [Roseateles sp. P5_E7]